MRQRGIMLLEQVVSIGLLGTLLLMVAATTVQTGRGSKNARINYEASNLVQSILEGYQARSVSLMSVGTQPSIQGTFSNGVTYNAEVVLSSMAGTPAASGLTDQDIKGIRVTLRWADAQGGQRQEAAEGVLIRIAR